MSEKICKNCRYSYRGIGTLICNISSRVYVNDYDKACDEFEERWRGRLW